MVSLLSSCSLMEKAGIINRQCKTAKDANAKYAEAIYLATLAYDESIAEEFKEYNRDINNCRENPDSYIRAYGKNSILVSLMGNKKFIVTDCESAFFSPNKLKNPPTVVSEYKNYYQVIINNQTCFKPEVVIEAQRYLGLIP
jgi:hypothetical protein